MDPDDRASSGKRRVLVVGVYLLDAPTWAPEITEALRSTAVHDVDITWAALGRGQVPRSLAGVTRVVESEPREKFVLVNQLLSTLELSAYDMLLVVDDDIEFEPGWLNRFLALQADAGLDLCQPARSPDSSIDHPLTKQLLGIDARLTRFVEIGPVVAVHRTAFEIVVPFDESWPMGWGLDLRWPVLLGAAGLQMGIIDGAPVVHRMRPPQAHYSPGATRERMVAALDPRLVLERDTAQRTLSTRIGGRWSPTAGPDHHDPSISVVVATRDRQDLLTKALAALAAQSLGDDTFEVVVIDDGSTDGTGQVVDSFAGLLPIRYARQEPSGLASARNHGLFLSRGDIVIFLDDDDVADTSLLVAHLEAHRRFPDPNVAILGYTDLAVDVAKSFLMRHITGATGHQLFSYGSMADQAVLEYTEFWGGRVSAKRMWLMQHEVFDPQFDFGCEDIELGYRLARHGLIVRFEARARSTMIRTLTLRGFLQRSTRQGRSIAKSFLIHDDPHLMKPLLLRNDELFCWTDPDPEFIESLITQTEALLDLADDALTSGVALAPSVEAEIGACVNYLHRVHIAGGYRSHMLGLVSEGSVRPGEDRSGLTTAPADLVAPRPMVRRGVRLR
jgi:glycosyltransferase involved in cell wall biosynthesis